MKINKTLIIISLLLIFCISLGAVSAADNTDISVNDINNNEVTTVESSVNVDDEISTVSEEGQINKSSEIYDDIKSATGTYNITTDYQIDKTWEIINNNVVIDGKGHTIYGNGNLAFKICGDGVTIKNLNFVNCSADWGGAIYFESGDGSVSGCSFVDCSASDDGGAIYFWIGGSVGNCSFVDCSASDDGGAIYFVSGDGSVGNCSFVNYSAIRGGAIYFRDSGSVGNCSFVGCSASDDGGAIYFYRSGSVSGCSFVNCSAIKGGAIYFWNDGVVSGCSFVNCSVSGDDGAIYFMGNYGSVNYCIFENNKEYLGNAIYISSGSINCDFNFFGFQNNVTDFPNDLIYGATPNNWVVLDIVNSSDEYVVKFVLNNGFSLNECMPDYNASLTINGVTEDICIKNNNFKGSLVDGDYLLTSLNTGNTLVNGIHDFNYIDYEIEVIDCEYGEDAIVNINFTSGISGNVTVKVDGGQEITKTITNNSVTIPLSGLSVGIHNLNIYYNGQLFYTSTVTVSPSFKYDMNVSVEDITYGQDTIINVTIPIDATGNVTLFINNLNITQTVNGGKVSFNLTKLGAGSYDFSLNYTGDKNYVSKLVTGSFNVEMYPSKLTVNAADVPYPSDVYVIVTLDAVNPSGNITYYLNGKKYIVKDVNDLGLIIRNLYGGFYSLVVEYSGDSNNTNSSDSCNFTVIRNNTYVMNVSASDITVGEVANVVVTLPDDAMGYVELYINDKYYGDSGVRGGVAEFNISGLNPNNYTIKAVYSGDCKYSPYENVSDFVVNKIHITVTPTALSTTYDSGKYFQVKVVNSKGKSVSGLKLSLKVYTGSSYKTVTVTTDANGIAKYGASKLSIATHKVVINVPNTNYFVDSNKNSTIKVSKAPTTVTAKKVTYRKGAKKYFTVTIKNKATGKVVKSIYLKIKVYTGKKYKTYTVKTNSKGIAKLSTRYLKRGTHKVVISTTSKYYTVSKSGKLIVIK